MWLRKTLPFDAEEKNRQLNLFQKEIQDKDSRKI